MFDSLRNNNSVQFNSDLLMSQLNSTKTLLTNDMKKTKTTAKIKLVT